MITNYTYVMIVPKIVKKTSSKYYAKYIHKQVHIYQQDYKIEDIN